MIQSVIRSLRLSVLPIAALVCLPTALCTPQAHAQEMISPDSGPSSSTQQQEPAPIVRDAPDTPPAPAQTGGEAPGANYDPSLFQRQIPKEQLAFLAQYDGRTSNELYRDKQFRRLMKEFVPDCTYHYGSDKSMMDALDEVIQGSPEPVVVRDGRYVMLGGHMGPYLAGRAMLWIDLEEGIGMGAFYFHPTNGEPTPVVNVFSRQVQKEMLLDYSELPAAFAQDLMEWERADGVPPLTTRYFITGSNKKILLEHDEDYCMPVAGAGYNDCDQMNADAADKDLEAAGYLEQTHHVTNATAWMISNPDTVVWIGVRDRRCGGVIDPLGCRVRMTRERTHVILHAPPPRPAPHPVHKD